MELFYETEEVVEEKPTEEDKEENKIIIFTMVVL